MTYVDPVEDLLVVVLLAGPEAFPQLVGDVGLVTLAHGAGGWENGRGGAGSREAQLLKRKKGNKTFSNPLTFRVDFPQYKNVLDPTKEAKLSYLLSKFSLISYFYPAKEAIRKKNLFFI